ncbi:response regulator [Accumulibacter sp.]|uniref:response regulator n=1 Tax=Accumulibacter sp. TaxID=2053492 RepID=UPI0025F8064C|nr:response regulator [Accumulibacter sp.]MCM8596834.1 response regulator [Accumulibacter sp.]MCM8624632.1 response regulator [Accumulibacter sp.]MDS4050982.1 response regulator [Accumulibacter sp.]
MSETSRPRVVVVDDNDLTRTLLRSILREGDYEVVGEARDGVGALALAERLRPEIICLDLVMPQMDGLEALQTIRLMYPEIAVVMLADRPSKQTVDESIRSGASGFIVKPFNAAKVLDTVGRARRSANRRDASQTAD